MTVIRRLVYVLAVAVVLVAFGYMTSYAQVTPSGGISRATLPLARVGNAVVLTTNGTIKATHLSATVATFGGITVESCVGCGSGSGGSGSIGTSSIDPRSLGTLKLWMKADAGVYSDTGCTTVITTGGTVACWVDQQNALAFKNSNASQQPAWLWNRRANHPVIMFGANGTGSGGANVFTGLTATSASGVALASFTECAAISPDGSTPNTSDIYDVFGSSTGTILGVQITSGFVYWQSAAPYAGVRHAGGYVPMLGSGRPSIACQTFDDATKLRRTWVDGYLASTDTEAGSIDYSGAFATLAYLPPSGADNYHGEIDEVLEWNAAFSPAVVGSATTYLRSRWNVDGGQGAGGSSSGGTTIPDPITVNNWQPSGGTANVLTPISISGSSTDTGHTTNGSGLVTGDFTDNGDTTAVGTLTGNIVVSQGGAFEAPSGVSMELIPPSGHPVILETSGTRPTCATSGSNQGSLWYSHGNTIGTSAVSACICSGVAPFLSCAWVDMATN